MADTIKGAVLGYGAAFNMGRAHANMMQNTDGIECVAVCDIDPERTDAAKEDFPAFAPIIQLKNLTPTTVSSSSQTFYHIVCTVDHPWQASRLASTLSLKNRCASQ